MNKSVYILLKSGQEVDMDNFQYITYPSNTDGKITTVKNFENFYLYGSRLLTFVGDSSIISINSSQIEFIKFFGKFTE